MISLYNNDIDKKIKVFVSSTFDDLNNERETLIKNVFPRLRRQFNKELLDVTCIDLRCGVSSQDILNQRILEVCLWEVIRCRPFFIGIIGNKYGSIISQKEINNLPPTYITEIGDNQLMNKSMTELEMRVGVFTRKNKDHSVFLIKKSSIVNENKDPRITNIINIVNQGYNSYVYDNINEFENLAYSALVEIIKPIVNTKKGTSNIDPHYLSHLSVLKENSEKYIEDELYISYIERKLLEKKKIYLFGEKGAGKTASVSKIVIDKVNNTDVNVFFHFATAGNKSLTIENVFWRLKQFLISISTNKNEIVNTHDAIIDLLIRNKYNNDVFLFFDGIEQYNDNVSIYKLFKFADINDRIHVLCAGTTDYSEELQECCIKIKELSKEQIRLISLSILNNFGKHYDNDIISRIIENNNCSNPLYLKVLLNHIRTYGDYKSFHSFFNDLTNAKDVKDLFTILINELSIYLKNRNLDESSINRLLSLIVYSNNGATENEIYYVAHVLPITRSIILSSMELFLIENNGLIKLNHDYIYNTVKNYLENQKINYRVQVERSYIMYFKNTLKTQRTYSELPYQLFCSQLYSELKEVIADINCFDFLLSNEYYSLVSYLSATSNYQLDILERIMPNIQAVDVEKYANVFCDAGCHQAVIEMLTNFKYHFTNAKRIKILDIISWSYYELASNDYDDAICSYTNLLKVYKSVYPNDIIGYANREALLGGTYKSAGKLDLAFSLYKESATIMLKNEIKTKSSIYTLDYYGNSCSCKGQLVEAIKVFEKAISICKYLYGDISTELGWTYCYSWSAFYYIGNQTKAKELVYLAYKIFETIYNGHGPKFAWAAQNRGIVKMIDDEFDSAICNFKTCIEENDLLIDEMFRPHPYSTTAYCNIANAYELKGEHQTAIRIIRRTIAQSVKKHGKEHIYTANVLLSNGIIEHNTKLIDEAIKIYEVHKLSVPDVYYAKMCLSRIYFLNKDFKKSKQTIKQCKCDYSKSDLKSPFIDYLIDETMEKLIGISKQDFKNEYRFADYKFYLTHNNASNTILIPYI